MYMRESDVWEQKPLYLAILELLQREGATGATVFTGVGGFGPGSSKVDSVASQRLRAPVVIEWIDRAERINQMLPLLDELLPDALITVEYVQVHRARLRSQGAFTSGQHVGDIMQSNPQTIAESATLGKVIALMLAYNQTIVPVVSTEKPGIIGVITEADIARRAGLFVPLRLLRLLNKDEGNDLMGPLSGRPVGEIINKEWRFVLANAFVQQALVLMIEWGYEQIPVLDRDNNMVGLLGSNDVFTAVINQQSAEEQDSNVQDVDQPTPVSLVMQHIVPQVPITQTLAFALQELLATPDRYLVVTDRDRQVLGSITDTSVFRNLNTKERAPVLDAIQRNATPKATDFPSGNRRLDVVIERDIPMITPKETIINAIQRLIECGVDRAPVVDEAGTLLGLTARGGLLRALIQER